MVVSSMPLRVQPSHPERSLRRSRARWSTVRITEARCLKSKRRTNHEHSVLWSDNPQWFVEEQPALVQLLGLCPLLAVTASVVNALGLAIATLFVLVTSNLCVSLIRNVVTDSFDSRLRSHHRRCRDGHRTIDAGLCLRAVSDPRYFSSAHHN